MNGFDKELAVALDAVKKAGNLLKGVSFSSFERKGDGSPVTKYDLLVDKVVTEVIHDSFPDVVVVSEERPVPKNASQYWLLDPIDGTDNFIEGNGEFSICLALVVDGEIVVGVVFAPVLDRLYYATAGVGAFCNGRHLSVAQKAVVGDMTIALSRHVGGDAKLAFGKRFPLGSSALRICAVADQLADIFLYVKKGEDSRLHDWDVAAALFIVKEAGGFVADLDLNPVIFKSPAMRISNGLVCTNKLFVENNRDLLLGL